MHYNLIGAYRLGLALGGQPNYNLINVYRLGLALGMKACNSSCYTALPTVFSKCGMMTVLSFIIKEKEFTVDQCGQLCVQFGYSQVKCQQQHHQDFDWVHKGCFLVKEKQGGR